MKKHRFRLPLQTEDDLREFVRLIWGVRIPDVQVCPEHTTPWRAFADAYFAKSPIAVWKSSRGFGGKSFLLALLGLTEAVTLKTNVNILGGSLEQSQYVHEYMRGFWELDTAPKQLLATNTSKQLTRLTWGNRIKALTASQRSVRGAHIARLRLDEVDEMDLAIFDAAMGQTMAQTMDGRIVVPAQTVCSSTHQHADGTMTEVLKRANDRGWDVKQWCFLESHALGAGWLLQEEIERKRGEVTAAMWETEFELHQPNPESRAIQPEKVQAMFRREWGEYAGRNGEYLEFEPPMVVCNKCGREWEYSGKKNYVCPSCYTGKVRLASYGTGADWAKKQDWSVVITWRFDVHPHRMVAFERCARMPWPDMIAKYNRRVQRYPGGAQHDGTGVGDVVEDYAGRGEGILMTGNRRRDLFTNYIAAIEAGALAAPFVEYMETEHRLCAVDDLYGSGHPPDTIVAGALGYDARGAGSFIH